MAGVIFLSLASVFQSVKIYELVYSLASFICESLKREVTLSILDADCDCDFECNPIFLFRISVYPQILISLSRKETF